jgi:ribosomal protein S18 acetylase RimI-like enzyme
LLTLQPIFDTATPAFTLAWQLYEEAFPAEERRNLGQQEELLAQEHYRFYAVQKADETVGVVGLWQFAQFEFLEHLAMTPVQRGLGWGKQVLDLLKDKSPSRVMVLEVEPPHTTLAQRRIGFYARSGFHLNAYPYQQPPYAPEKPWVPLQIMSYPTALGADTFHTVVQDLYQKVYQVPGN